MSSPLAPVRGAAAGLALHLEGARLLARERSLWRLAAVPLALAVVALGLAVGALVTWGSALAAFATGWLPALHAGAWYAWLWVGPLSLLFWLVEGLVFLALCAAVVVAAWLLANVLAAPFHDELSRRVERLVTGGVDDRAAPGLLGLLAEGGRSMGQELRRVAFFLAVQAAIALVGVVVPGGQVLAPPAMTLFSVLFLPLDYASYTFDRRRVSFPRRRRWVIANGPAMLGFGGAAFLTLVIPGVNFLAMPVLVVSGTLLALRTPVPEA